MFTHEHGALAFAGEQRRKSSGAVPRGDDHARSTRFERALGGEQLGPHTAFDLRMVEGFAKSPGVELRHDRSIEDEAWCVAQQHERRCGERAGDRRSEIVGVDVDDLALTRADAREHRRDAKVEQRAQGRGVDRAHFTDCAELRRHTALPMILDECVLSVEDLVRAKVVVGATGVNIKPGRLGGFTNARAVRDTAQGLGMTFTVDDTWGGALVTAQNSHLAASSQPDLLTAATFFSEWTEPLIATGPRALASGRGDAPALPGLGVTVDRSLLTGPVIDV